MIIRPGRHSAAIPAAWAVLVVLAVGGRAWPRIVEARDAFRGPVAADPAWFAACWTDTARAAAWAAAFALAALGAGGSALAALGRWPSLDRAERVGLTFALGLGVNACGAVSLGLCGLWHRGIAAALVLALAAAGVLRAAGWRPPRAGRERGRRETAWLRRSVAGLALLSGLFTLAPQTWADSLYYHLNAPADFADLHKWVDVDEAVYRYPLLAEALFGPALLVGGEKTAGLVNLLGAAPLAALLFALARRLAGTVAAWLALLALLASDQVGFHLGQANQGFYSTSFAFVAVWAWFRTRSGGAPARWMAVAGAGMAWAVCAKYTAIAPLAGMALWEAAAARAGFGRRLRGWAAFGAGFAAAGAAFLVNDWLFTRNPVYPLLFGGIDWGPVNARLLGKYGCPGFDFSLARPAELARAAGDFLVTQQPLVLLALPFAAAVPWRGLAGFWTAWGGALAVWAVFIPCFRLMLPAYPAVALIAGVGLAAWWERGGVPGRIARAATAAVGLLGAAHAVAAADFHERSFQAAVGLEEEDHFMRRTLTGYWHALTEVNARVPFLTRVLAVGEGRGYRFRPLVFNRGPEDLPPVYDLVHASRSPAEIAKRMRERGFAYVLFNWIGEEFHATFRAGAFAWTPDEMRRWWEYWRRHATVEWTDPEPDAKNGGYVLFRLTSRPRAPGGPMAFLPGTAQYAVREPDETEETWTRRLVFVDDVVPGVAYFEARKAARVLDAGLDPVLAVEAAREGLATDYPERAKLYALQGAAYNRLGRYDAAAKSFAAAAKLNPGDSRYERLRAEAARNGGERD